MEIAKRMVKAGHDVNMITTRRDSPGTSQRYSVSNIEGITVHRFSVPYANEMSFFSRLQAFLRFAWCAYKKAREIPADLVYATSTPLTVAIPGALAAHYHNIPFVLEVRDLWPAIPVEIGAIRSKIIIKLAEWLERWSYQKARHIIALSPGIKDAIMAKGVPDSKLTVIPNAADNTLFDDVKFPESEKWHLLRNKKYVIYAGAFGLVNRVSYLIEIAERLPDVTFLLIGEGRELQNLKKLADEKSLRNKNVFIYDAAPKKEMLGLVKHAVVSASVFQDLPSIHTNSANKFFDSLAAGVPVMINYGGWQAELLNQTSAGIVVPPNEPDEAADILRNFLADKEEIKKAGQAAKKLALDKFDRDKLTLKLQSVLESLI